MLKKLKRNNHIGWIIALRTMGEKDYWNKENSVEFFAFFIKGCIVVPGLIFGIQFWVFYVFALISSIMLIWSSTIKTIPTLIWFNILWIILSTIILFRYFI